MSGPDVVVVGAGFAGLSAAAALADRGRRVHVVDARPQLGGRATAFRDRVTGELVDNGQHVLFGCYHETFAFLRRIGAEALVPLQRAMTVPSVDRSGRRSVLRCPPLPSPLHLLAGVLRWDPLPWQERLAVLRLAPTLLAARRALRAGRPMPVAADETVGSWLRSHGQGPALQEWLWEPLAVAALNQSVEEAAAAPFLRVLAGLFGPDARDAALALPAAPLHLAYAEPARAFVERHGGVVRDRALARVVAGPSGEWRVDAGGEHLATPRLIAAVPWFALGNLFGNSVPPALAAIVANASRMEARAIVTVNLWYDGPVMQDPFVGVPGRAIHWVFDKRLVVGGTSSHLSLVVSGADRLAAEPDAAIVGIAVRELAGALPETTRRALIRSTVVRERRATFSLAPGQPPRPGTRTPLPGLYLAGDWTDTGLPGTIESAVVSGHRAAAAVLEDAGSSG